MNVPEWNIDVLLIQEELERTVFDNFDYIAYGEEIRVTKGNIKRVLQKHYPEIAKELNLRLSERNIAYIDKEVTDFSRIFNKYCKKKGIKQLPEFKVKSAFIRFVGWRRYMKRYVLSWVYNHK